VSARLKCFLVDDEAPALKRLSRLLEATRRVDIVGSSMNPAEAIDAISSALPDVLFLDIQMPEINGFQLLSHLCSEPLVVFTTAYDQYALKAFEVNSIDYLLKPVEPEQLERALNKLDQFRGGARPEWLERPDFRAMVEELSRSLRDTQGERLLRIPIRVGERTRFLELSRVTHFYSEDKLTYAQADGKTYCIDSTIADLERQLGQSRFVRIHRGTLLNVDWLEELTPFFTGRLIARLKDERRTELTVSRDRVRSLKERLGI
jgi:two-component system, LytTR family, response regulator